MSRLCNRVRTSRLHTKVMAIRSSSAIVVPIMNGFPYFHRSRRIVIIMLMSRSR